jgi:aspartyl-tRNA(Asn)/glutamyl-tRNA(Gln) amidotransferase subunit A
MTIAVTASTIAERHQNPCLLTIDRLGDAIRRGRLSIRGVIESSLSCIATADKTINAFLFVDPEGAREAAERLEKELTRGHDRGPLHGVPVAVKDLFATRGQPTSAGSRLLAKHVTDHDALVVRRLREAGAIIVGKTQMNEFAFGVTGLNSHFAPVRNPRATDRIVGGSSSGSAAAVAAGMCVGALGTDTGGSIRIPAALTGIVGFKPTFDVVSRDGVLPLSDSLDHVGPLTRTVVDTRILFECIAGKSMRSPRPAASLSGLRLGILEDHCTKLDEDVADAWNRFLETMRSVGVELSSLEGDATHEAMVASTVIMFSEAAEVHRDWVRTRRDEYDPATRARLIQGSLLPATTFVQAQRIRERLRRRLAAYFESVDVIACPTQAAVACQPSKLNPQVIQHMLRNTRLAPLLGNPAISLPLPSRALPVGLQLIAKAQADEDLLTVAAAIERTIGAQSSVKEDTR